MDKMEQTIIIVASLLQHSSDNGTTFVPITTTISGSGSGNILVKQTSGYWVDFDDPMKYPYYRFRITGLSIRIF